MEGRIATIEHVVGNIFKARVFPVPKEGRTVKVIINVQIKSKIIYLSEIKNGRYDCPLQFPTSIQTFNCTIEVSLEQANFGGKIPSGNNPRIIDSDLHRLGSDFTLKLSNVDTRNTT